MGAGMLCFVRSIKMLKLSLDYKGFCVLTLVQFWCVYMPWMARLCAVLA